MSEVLRPTLRPYSGQLASTSLHPSCTGSSRHSAVLDLELKMIRSYLRGLTRTNTALALLGVTGTLLSGCGGLAPASQTPAADPQLNQSINHMLYLVKETR